MTIPVRTAIEALAVSDSLSSLVVQIGRLERSGFLSLEACPEAAYLMQAAPMVAESLSLLAARLASREQPRPLRISN